MTQTADGYEFDPQDNSVYLRLKSKGDKIKIRLVSKPIKYLKEFVDKTKDDEVTMTQKFAWVVLDKTNPDNVMVKAFEGGVSIYKVVKDLFLNEDWGDPANYDLTIERTEEPGGGYYKVTPSPKKSNLTAGEMASIDEANLDLCKLFKVDEWQPTHTFGLNREFSSEAPKEKSNQEIQDEALAKLESDKKKAVVKDETQKIIDEMPF